MSDYMAEARHLRSIIEQAVDSLPDKVASEAPTLCHILHGDGQLVRSGTRICWKGAVLRAASDLWDRPDNHPDKAPNLWERIEYRDGVRIIPQTITVGKAFSKGEKGWWGDILYVSKVDSNVYTPTQYPQNWDLYKGD